MHPQLGGDPRASGRRMVLQQTYQLVEDDPAQGLRIAPVQLGQPWGERGARSRPLRETVQVRPVHPAPAPRPRGHEQPVQDPQPRGGGAQDLAEMT
ncbi:hypothetical protein [Streptomyces sp. NPDC059468]|uniref:hypothetical protein n=1 Tax=Streptomyces sp. NPDC059468 TaxID=3346845 RepID=UPI0036900895